MAVCAYCLSAPAVHRDHVIAKAMRRRHGISDKDARFHVRACANCNWRKGTRKFYPRGFDASLLPGKGWQEWDGGKLLEVKR